MALDRFGDPIAKTAPPITLISILNPVQRSTQVIKILTSSYTFTSSPLSLSLKQYAHTLLAFASGAALAGLLTTFLHRHKAHLAVYHVNRMLQTLPVSDLAAQLKEPDKLLAALTEEVDTMVDMHLNRREGEAVKRVLKRKVRGTFERMEERERVKRRRGGGDVVVYLEKGEEEERFVRFLRLRVPRVVVTEPDGSPGLGGGGGGEERWKKKKKCDEEQKHDSIPTIPSRHLSSSPKHRNTRYSLLPIVFAEPAPSVSLDEEKKDEAENRQGKKSGNVQDNVGKNRWRKRSSARVKKTAAGVKGVRRSKRVAGKNSSPDHAS